MSKTPTQLRGEQQEKAQTDQRKRRKKALRKLRRQRWAAGVRKEIIESENSSLEEEEIPTCSVELWTEELWTEDHASAR